MRANLALRWLLPPVDLGVIPILVSADAVVAKLSPAPHRSLTVQQLEQLVQPAGATASRGSLGGHREGVGLLACARPPSTQQVPSLLDITDAIFTDEHAVELCFLGRAIPGFRAVWLALACTGPVQPTTPAYAVRNSYSLPMVAANGAAGVPLAGATRETFGGNA